MPTINRPCRNRGCKNAQPCLDHPINRQYDRHKTPMDSFKTLRRWYYEGETDKKKRLKNETTQETVENTDDNEKKTPQTPMPTCFKCQKNPVELRNGKPRGENAKY